MPMSPRTRISFTRFGDIELAPRKRHLVRGMLGVGDMSCLFGPPGCGKSVLAGDLAVHVAAGRAEWFGRAIAAGPVLYLAAERADLVKRRLAAWRRKSGMSAEQAAAIPLVVANGVIDLLHNDDAAGEIIAMARTLAAETGQRTALIVVDTVSRTMAGGDENSSADMGRLVASLHRIQIETGAHVMVIHHTPVDGSKRMRGHGALLGACDTTIAVEKHAQIRTATVEKANDGPEGERIAFTLESVELRRDGDEVTTAPVVAASSVEMVTKQATRGKPVTRPQSIALEALRSAIEEAGAEPPTMSPIPPEVRTVTRDEWRRRSYERGISTGATPQSRKKAFNRAADDLQEAGLVATWNENVWISGAA